MTPLKQARIARGWRLVDVSARLASLGDQVDPGNLSRIERGAPRASAALAESLCLVFDHEITEIHVLYPERFQSTDEAVA